LSYPATEDAFADADIRVALEKVGLGAFAERLDTIENWSNVLSGGEQQRVSLVRALLRKPAWLFLDEATAAVDEATEASLYGLLREALPNTTIVSIGHRSSLAALHDRRIHIVKNGAKAHLEDAPLETFGAKP
jgi:putative ATP-binding cassette transporter